MFERTRTIKGKQYRYQEERWREDGKVKSRSTYLGPVVELLKALVKKKPLDDLTETREQESARVAREEIQYAKDARINKLLTAPTISLEGIAEISTSQASSPSDNSSSGSQSQAGQSDGDALM